MNTSFLTGGTPVAVLFLLLAPPIYARGLNDTGMKSCQGASGEELACPVSGYPRQDAEVGRDALAAQGKLTKIGGGHGGFDFTKLGSLGQPLPADAIEWDCVRDNVTHLVWENKTDDGGLRDRDNSYSWYNPNNATNGGFKGLRNGGVCTGSGCDTHAYAKAINAIALCGFSHWRMPKLEELRSIQDLSGPGECFLCPAIDTDYFAHAKGSDVYDTDVVWTATPYVDPKFSWTIQFDTNYDFPTEKDYPFPIKVRLVSNGK